ncbi:TetR/AcrR family transcriptional repressor of nem operon [Paraburkholderia sp. GAS41]|uniref:TetR/AcrR family transcriptional regulator n=1 Tax=Paraburkholderia sp. GAS41 TaxID=3035134 RepID=UPI003D2387A9
MDATSTVREKIVGHAIRLMMLRGYNGFSYRDLSKLVGVKTSSIHYYFPAKDDLVLEAVNEYSKEVLDDVHLIDVSLSADAKLAKYTKKLGKILGEGDRICLCGMLAADIESLPDNVRHAVQAFFKANKNWLTKVLSQGAKEGSLAFNGKAECAARTVFAAYQGSALASRLFQTRSRLENIDYAWKVRK